MPPVPPAGPAGPFGAGGASFGGTGTVGGAAFPPVGTPGATGAAGATGATFSAGPQTVAAPAARKSRKVVGCLIVALVVVLGVGATALGVAFLGFAGLTATDGPDSWSDARYRPLGGEMTILRDEDGNRGEDGDEGEPDEVVALASRYGTGDRSVVLAELDGDGGEVRWEASVVADDVYTASFVATHDLVIAGLGRRVVGLDRDTGETAWQADLPDVIRPGCADCLEVVGDHVVAFTSDAQVTVLDPTDGTAPWARRLESASGWVTSMGDHLLVVDEPADATTTVTLTDVADGRAIASHSPSCDDPVFEGSTITPTPSQMVLERVPDTGDLVAQFAFGQACTTRWEATTGTVRWARAIEGSVDSDAETALTATDMVTPSSQGLIHVSLAEGSVTVVPPPADSHFGGPAGLEGSTAMAVATTTRGTPRPVIVAVDLRSGQHLWTIDLPPSSEPMVPDDQFGATILPGGAAFVLVPSTDGLRLVTVEAGGRLVVSEVDPATGRTEIVGTDALHTGISSAPSVYLESVGADDVVITTGDAVQVVDLATGTVTESWIG